jgi:hypothetical protein
VVQKRLSERRSRKMQGRRLGDVQDSAPELCLVFSREVDIVRIDVGNQNVKAVESDISREPVAKVLN